MARYSGPVCRLCRREGMKLFLKGERCHTEKCAIEKRNFAPGQHGKDKKAKIVGYGLQLAREAESSPLLPHSRRPVPQSLREGRQGKRASPANTCWPCSKSASITWCTAWVSLPAAHKAAKLFVMDTSRQRQESQHSFLHGEARRHGGSAREQQEQHQYFIRARRHRPPPQPRSWLEVDREAI